MKLKLYLAVVLCSFILNVSAQEDSHAIAILAKTEDAYLHANGIKASFVGSSKGTILLMDEKFHLLNDQIETWFDGVTQWSYVKQNEEVNVSTPTQEELQFLNPYALLSLYKQGYHYTLVGKKAVKGKMGTEILLTPIKKNNIVSIRLIVNATFQPLSIRIQMESGESNEFIVTSYETQQGFSSDEFVFPAKKYPMAEVIDLR